MQVQLSGEETFRVIQPQTWIAGEYKQHLICGSPFGYFIVQPDKVVISLFGLVVYTNSPQEAGDLLTRPLPVHKRQQPGNKPRPQSDQRQPIRLLHNTEVRRQQKRSR